MENKKQTAVEFYRKHLHALVSTSKTEYKTEQEIFAQAKEMEKKQIENAFRIGATTELTFGDNKAEQYYNETYGS